MPLRTDVNNGPLCVAVINLKGGVGKTTITALLGRHAVGVLGLKVLAVDLDPQANLSQAYMRKTYRQVISSSRPSIVEVFSGMHPPAPGKPSPTPLKIEEAVVPVSSANKGGGQLDLIPSRFDFSNHLTDSLKPDASVLARCIANHFQEKDLVLIDCAPTESVFTTAAYHASRFVLVPVRPEFFATIGFPLLRQSLDAFRHRNRGHKIGVVGVVINNAFYDGGNDGGARKTAGAPRDPGRGREERLGAVRYADPALKGLPEENAWRLPVVWQRGSIPLLRTAVLPPAGAAGGHALKSDGGRRSPRRSRFDG